MSNSIKEGATCYFNGFGDALEFLKSHSISISPDQVFIRRKKTHPDFAVCLYKTRLYWVHRPTAVRTPYVPTNKDLLACDWEQVSKVESGETE